MGTVTKLNDVLCVNISKVDDILKANASKWDDNTFCPVSPTPTPTPTKTVTPTPTPSPAVNCVDGETTNGGFYSFYDCCGVYFEGSGELPFVACYDANKLNTGISFGDPCSYSCVTPTPTITPTMTPTPTSTPTSVPCDRGCCFVELCYSERDCSDACVCNDVRGVYLSQPCQTDPCELAYADGIYKNDGCTDPAGEGYYSSGTDCWYWDATNLTLTYQGPC
jgi:hypothetical protein